MKTTSHLKLTIVPWVRGSIRCPPLRRVFLFVPLLLALWPSLALSQSITTVDVPGADYTSVDDINNLGTVAGIYCCDSNGGAHGFVRSRGRVITKFDPPGSIYTDVEAINQEGTVTGSYFAPGGPYGFVMSHGFVRSANGRIASFDAPPRLPFEPPPLGTSPVAISQSGAVTGSDTDPIVVQTHGFVRDPSGAITVFDVLGIEELPFFFTEPRSISVTGVITGRWGGLPPNSGSHGFVRASDGTITTFDVPGAISTGATFPESINLFRTIVGDYTDPNGVGHGFLRTSDGNITTFDVPGAGSGVNQGTFPKKINAFGVVTGSYTDANLVLHGFVGPPLAPSLRLMHQVLGPGSFKARCRRASTISEGSPEFTLMETIQYTDSRVSPAALKPDPERLRTSSSSSDPGRYRVHATVST